MTPTAQVLSEFETCPRKGWFFVKWEPRRLKSADMTRRAIKAAVAAQEAPDYGDMAGSHVMQDAEQRGLDTTIHEAYPSVIHHATLADILTFTIRKSGDKPWIIPDRVGSWESSCLISPDGSHLRRIVLASHWTAERQESESRNWYSLGEMAVYGLPMQLVVFVIGHEIHGKRVSPWVKGYLHPQSGGLRFRRRDRAKSASFNQSWRMAWREEHGEISREKWLNSMLTDDVLPDIAFRVDIPALRPIQRNQIRDMSTRKLERLYALTEKPDKNLSSCDWPLPCPYKLCCWRDPERMPTQQYFLRQTVLA
jgi:hypothetical protein